LQQKHLLELQKASWKSSNISEIWQWCVVNTSRGIEECYMYSSLRGWRVNPRY